MLDSAPMNQLEGDQLPFWVDDAIPGKQPGDFAGFAGRGYAKVLQGRIDGQGALLKPVPFIDAESVFSNTTIPRAPPISPGSPLPCRPRRRSDRRCVQAQIYYRRAWRAIAVTKNWVQK